MLGILNSQNFATKIFAAQFSPFCCLFKMGPKLSFFFLYEIVIKIKKPSMQWLKALFPNSGRKSPEGPEFKSRLEQFTN